MNIPRDQQRAFLLRVARRAMAERGLEPDFSAAALAEVSHLTPPNLSHVPGADVRDLRKLLWCSIDNDDSRDLDQLTVAEALPDGNTKVMVAVADVSSLVEPESALDSHAAANTTSVYTPPQNFPMLPERLSTDLTSLNQGEDRLAMVAEMTVDTQGHIAESSVYPALVRNQAKLAYSSVGAWLEGQGQLPVAASMVAGLADNLKLQDQMAQILKTQRHEHGALQLEAVEVRAHFAGDTLSGLAAEKHNRAQALIEDFMIAANGAIARFLEDHHFPVLRRVVRSPERWQRIVALALEHGEHLPPEPDSKALNAYLIKRRAADPLRFPDLSLAVIKLMGRGEYVASFPGDETVGHFGLAVNDYTHSTAPNRRYPDLITQRLLKAVLAGRKVPYGSDQLAALATHCTAKEDDAQKVERLMRKAAAALVLGSMLGREFDGIITGASPKGTWVRIFDPPAEGRVEQGSQGLDVGDRVRVRLIHTDPERGFIDFARAGHS
jgi:VacB/RNase II family 3'-5' exoribonuclease